MLSSSEHMSSEHMSLSTLRPPVRDVGDISDDYHGLSEETPITLFRYQKRVQEEIIKANHSALVCFPTGAGKTHVAGAIIASLGVGKEPGKKACLIANTGALVAQHGESLTSWVKASCILGIHGSRKYVGDPELLIVTPEKILQLMEAGTILLAKMAIVVIDEIHNSRKDSPMRRVCAAVSAIEKTQRPLLIGLSATLSYSVQSRSAMERDILTLVIETGSEAMYAPTEEELSAAERPKPPEVTEDANATTLIDNFEYIHSLDRRVIPYAARPSEFWTILTGRLEKNEGTWISMFLYGCIKNMERDMERESQRQNLPLSYPITDVDGKSPVLSQRKGGEWANNSIKLIQEIECNGNQMNGEYMSQFLPRLKVLANFYKVFWYFLTNWEEVPHDVVLYLLMKAYERGHRTYEMTVNSIVGEFFAEAPWIGEVITPSVIRSVNLLINGCIMEHRPLPGALIMALKKQFANNAHAKGIVFTQQRMRAEIYAWFISVQGLGRAKALYKWTKGSVAVRINATQRNAILEEFRNGYLDIIVATSTVEEGIDVPDANFIIQVEAPANAVSSQQRGGRARAEASKNMLLRTAPGKRAFNLRTAKSEHHDIVRRLCKASDSTWEFIRYHRQLGEDKLIQTKLHIKVALDHVFLDIREMTMDERRSWLYRSEPMRILNEIIHQGELSKCQFKSLEVKADPGDPPKKWSFLLRMPGMETTVKEAGPTKKSAKNKAALRMLEELHKLACEQSKINTIVEIPCISQQRSESSMTATLYGVSDSSIFGSGTNTTNGPIYGSPTHSHEIKTNPWER